MRIARLALLGLLGLRTGAQAGDAWVSIGPGGGAVEFVAAAASASQIVYASSKRGGVFVSEDAGATWRAVNAGLSDLRVQCLAVSPADARTVYAGTQSGISRTDDGGASWITLGGGLPAALVNSIAIDPSSPETLYAAGTSGTLAKSTNGGATWSAIGAGTVAAAAPRILAVDPAHPATLYLGTLQGGVFRSDDGGANWTARNTGLTSLSGQPSLSINAVAVDPTSPSRLYVGTAGDGIFRSTDQGANWVAANEGLGLIQLVTAIVVAPDGNAYTTLQNQLFTRSPGAPAWSTIPAARIQFFNSIAIGSGAVPPLFIGFGKAPFESGGFARWDGGDAFQYSSIPLAVVTTLASDPSAPSRALAGFTDPGISEYSADRAEPWAALPCCVNSGPGNLATSILFDVRSPGAVYAGTLGGVFRSGDGGRSGWSASSSGIPAGTVVRCLLALPGTSEGLLAGTLQGLYQTSDGGANWTAGAADLASRQVFALAADPRSASTLWAGTDDGVYRSADAGAHFSRAGTSVGGIIHAVLVASSGEVYAGTDTGLFTSGDAGATWTAAGVAAAVNALFEEPATGTLYAGTPAGVFASANGGASWTSESEGLTNPGVLCFTSLSDGTLLAGTNGGSVFELVRTSGRGLVGRTGAQPAPRTLSPRR